jgi:hypothetical protein
VLVRQVPTGAAAALRHELAALKLLEGQSDLPVVSRFQLLHGLGRPSAVSAILPGSTGKVWIGRGKGEEVIRSVGRALAVLASHPMHRFGDRAMDGLFLPSRPTWGGAWQARVAGLSGDVLAGGVDLGSLQQQLFRAIHQRLPHLDQVSAFGLVHGDLQPGNLLFRLAPEGLALSGVIDWEYALVGDPLVDWARSMLVPAETLRGVVAGFGADRAREVFGQPGAVERLELYWLTQLLERLALCAGPLAATAGLRARGLAHAQALIRTFFDEGGARPRLDVALASGEATVAGIPVADPLFAGRHALADAMVRGAVDGVEASWNWVGAVQALVLADQVSLARKAWTAEAVERSGRLVPESPRAAEPIASRAEWLAGVLHVVAVTQLEQRGAGTGLMTLSAGMALASGLQFEVGDGFLRQLEAASVALCAQDERWMGAGVQAPQVRLTHALISLAALDQLRRAVADCPGVAPLEAGLRTLMSEALDQLDTPSVTGDLLDFLEAGPPQHPGAGRLELAPALCAALLWLDEHGTLPVSATSLAAALGLRRGEAL